MLVAVSLTLLSLSSFFGSWWWVLDLAANFRPQYTALLGGLGGLLVFGRWRRTGLMVLLGAVVNASVVAPLFVAPGPDGVVTGERIRVVSFNVRGDNHSFQAVADYLAEQRADVVFLHEATREWVEAPELRRLGYRIVAPQSPGLVFGTLVLAGPDDDVIGYGFAEGEPRSVEVVTSTEGGTTIRILGVHAVSPDSERRAGLRDAQLRFAAEWAAGRDDRVVVVGDFNATPWSYAFRRLQRIGGLENSQRGFGIQASFPATSNPLLRVPIDHLLYGRGLMVTGRRLGPPLGSDHFPLVVDLAVTR